MSSESITAHCNACRATFKVPESSWGKAGSCPNCDNQMVFPAPEGYSSDAKKRIKSPCQHCGTKLVLPPSKAGKRIRCPKCGHKTTIAGTPPKSGSGEDGYKMLDTNERRARSAWEEMQQQIKDSYWLALWKGALYPFHAFGALVFFVVGVPFTILLSELIARWALTWGGDFFGEDGSQMLSYFAFFVVGAAVFAVACMFSFFASFLFAVIRTSSSGREAIPVIEGMNHRSNASALITWAFAYFGPGLFIGFKSAGEGELFSWSFPTVFFFLIFLLFAPMGLLCSATINAIAGLNPVIVFKTLGAIFDRYAYMLMVWLVTSAVFVGLGIYFGGHASAALSGEDPNYAVGIPCRLAQGLFLMIPTVILARCLGLIVNYHAKDLPFEIDLYSEHKGSLAPQLLAAFGLFLLIMPIHTSAVEYAGVGGVFMQCNRHLESFYDTHLRYDIDRVHYPMDHDGLVKYIGEHNLRCPAYPDEYPFYQVAGFLSSVQVTTETRKFVWIYEGKPTHPDGDKLNAMLLGGTVKVLSVDKLEALLEIQKRYADANDDIERERIMKQYTSEFAGF